MAVFYTPLVGNYGDMMYKTGSVQAVTGQADWSSYNGSVPVSSLVKAGETAAKNGDTKWLKVVDTVLVYGEQVLGILTRTGILKNKNASNDELLQAIATGNINRSLGTDVYNQAATDAASRSANLLGIPTSTWVLILAAVVVYMLLNQPAVKSKKK